MLRCKKRGSFYPLRRECGFCSTSARNEQLRKYFSGHDCQTARYAGFAGLENGQLLDAAEAAKFDVVLTVDRGFEYQQNVGQRRIAVIIFCGRSVLLEDLMPLVPDCLAHLKTIRLGQVVRIGE